MLCRYQYSRRHGPVDKNTHEPRSGRPANLGSLEWQSLDRSRRALVSRLAARPLARTECFNTSAPSDKCSLDAAFVKYIRGQGWIFGSLEGCHRSYSPASSVLLHLSGSITRPLLWRSYVSWDCDSKFCCEDAARGHLKSCAGSRLSCIGCNIRTCRKEWM